MIKTYCIIVLLLHSGQNPWPEISIIEPPPYDPEYIGVLISVIRIGAVIIPILSGISTHPKSLICAWTLYGPACTHGQIAINEILVIFETIQSIYSIEILTLLSCKNFHHL